MKYVIPRIGSKKQLVNDNIYMYILRGYSVKKISLRKAGILRYIFAFVSTFSNYRLATLTSLGKVTTIRPSLS